MDQQNPSDWGTGSSGSMGGSTTGSGTGSTFGTSGSGMSSGSGMDSGMGTGGTNTGGFGVSSATDSGLCPTCGQSTRGGGLEQFLGRLGITDDMMNNLKGQFQNVDIDEYLNTA